MRRSLRPVSLLPVLLLLFSLSMGLLPARELELAPLEKSCVPSGDGETRVLFHPRGGVLEFSTRFREEGSRRACWDIPFRRTLAAAPGYASVSGPSKGTWPARSISISAWAAPGTRQP